MMNEIAIACREQSRKLQEKQALNRLSTIAVLEHAADEIERLQDMVEHQHAALEALLLTNDEMKEIFKEDKKKEGRILEWR
jgi:uncharacterized protein YgbK (DUF1537 family)